MAKETIMMSCGHEETVELLGKRTERDRKIEYYKAYGLCKACYRKKCEEEAAKMGLYLNVSVYPRINEENGEMLLFLWFSGNTRPHKDDIKTLGYRWAQSEVTDDEQCVRRELCWGKLIGAEELNGEIEKAVAIGAESRLPDNGLQGLKWYHVVKEDQEDWKTRQEELASVPKPKVPDVVKGRSWNGKLYGGAKKSVYLDGEQVMLADAEVEEIKRYQSQKEEYQKKILEIKRKFQ